MNVLDTGPSFGGRLGQALGSSLEQLAHSKLQKLQQEGEQLKYQQAIGSIPGMNPEVSKLLSQLSPEERKVLLPNIESLNNLFQGRSQAPAATGTDGQPVQNGGAPVAGGNNNQAPAPGSINNLFQSSQDRQNKEKINLQKLQYAQPIFEKVEAKARPARELQEKAEKALGSIDKAISGPAGKITPQYLQSAEGQYLESLLNRIVVLNAQTGKGVPSIARLKLEQGSKAAIWQQPKVIKQIMRDILDNPEFLRDIAEGVASEDIQENIDSYDLTKLNSLLKKKSKEYLHQGEKARASKFTLQSLEQKFPASKLEDGKIAENPITGQDEFVVRNGKWEKI